MVVPTYVGTYTHFFPLRRLGILMCLPNHHSAEWSYGLTALRQQRPTFRKHTAVPEI